VECVGSPSRAPGSTVRRAWWLGGRDLHGAVAPDGSHRWLGLSGVTRRDSDAARRGGFSADPAVAAVGTETRIWPHSSTVQFLFRRGRHLEAGWAAVRSGRSSFDRSLPLLRSRTPRSGQRWAVSSSADCPAGRPAGRFVFGKRRRGGGDARGGRAACGGLPGGGQLRGERGASAGRDGDPGAGPEGGRGTGVPPRSRGAGPEGARHPVDRPHRARRRKPVLQRTRPGDRGHRLQPRPGPAHRERDGSARAGG